MLLSPWSLASLRVTLESRAALLGEILGLETCRVGAHVQFSPGLGPTIPAASASPLCYRIALTLLEVTQEESLLCRGTAWDGNVEEVPPALILATSIWTFAMREEERKVVRDDPRDSSLQSMSMEDYSPLSLTLSGVKSTADLTQ